MNRIFQVRRLLCQFAFDWSGWYDVTDKGYEHRHHLSIATIVSARDKLRTFQVIVGPLWLCFAIVRKR